MTERFSITGPIGIDGSESNARTVELYTGESYDVSGQTQTQSESPPTEESDEAILTPLEGSREYSLSGLTTIQSISKGYPSYSNKESLRRWLYGLEALVLPQQGLGYEINDILRAEDIDPRLNPDRSVLISQVRWTLDSDDITRAEWEVEFELAEGVQEVSKTPQEYIEEQKRDSVTADAVGTPEEVIEVDEVTTRRVARSIDVNVVNLMHNTDLPVTGFFDSGVREEVQFDGVVTTDDSQSLDEKAVFFDTEVHGETVRVFDEYSDRVFEGAVDSSSTSFESGKANSFEFRLSLDVGRSFGTL